MRDVEAALADALGPQAALSNSTVSPVCLAIRDEFDAWRTRRLDEMGLDYLLLDGSHFKMHAGTRAEPARRPATGGRSADPSLASPSVAIGRPTEHPLRRL